MHSWQCTVPRIAPLFDYSTVIPKGIYTASAIESAKARPCNIAKSLDSFPTDGALIKLYYLALRNISKKSTMRIQNWKAAPTRFTVLFDECMPHGVE